VIGSENDLWTLNVRRLGVAKETPYRTVEPRTKLVLNKNIIPTEVTRNSFSFLECDAV
jgi:hypothetical protein